MTIKSYESKASTRRALMNIGKTALHAYADLVTEKAGKFRFNLEKAEEIQAASDNTSRIDIPRRDSNAVTIHHAPPQKTPATPTKKAPKAPPIVSPVSPAIGKVLLPNAAAILKAHGCPYCGDTSNGCTYDAEPGKETDFVYCHLCDTSFNCVTGKLRAAARSIPHTRESTVDSPCFVVWDTADAMKGARRKDVIAACVTKGVAFYTARTQYQLWRTSKKNDEKK